MRLLTEDGEGPRARALAPAFQPQGGSWNPEPGGSPQRGSAASMPAGEREERLKLDPVSWVSGSDPSLSHRPGPRRTVLTFSFRSYGRTFGTF